MIDRAPFTVSCRVRSLDRRAGAASEASGRRPSAARSVVVRLVLSQELLEARRSRLDAANAKLPQSAEAALQQLADLRVTLVAAALVRIRELEDDVRAMFAAKRAALDVDLRATTDLAKRATKLAGDAMQAVAVMGDVDVLTNAARLRAMLDALRAEVESTCGMPVEDSTIELRVPEGVLDAISGIGELITGGAGRGLASTGGVSVEGLPEDGDEAAADLCHPGIPDAIPPFRVAVTPAARGNAGYDAAEAVASLTRCVAVSAYLERAGGETAPVAVLSLDPEPAQHCVSVRLQLPAAGSPGGRVVLGRVTVYGIAVEPAQGPPLPRLLATIDSPCPAAALAASSLTVPATTPCCVPLSAAGLPSSNVDILQTSVIVAATDPKSGALMFVHPPQGHLAGEVSILRRLSFSEVGLDGPVRSCAWAPTENDGVVVVAGAVGSSSRIVALNASTLSLRWESALGDLNGCHGVCALPSLGVALASSCFDSQIHVFALLDGSRVGRIDCTAGASSGLRRPTFIAADDRSRTVFVSVQGHEAAHCVAAWRWEAGEGGSGAAEGAAPLTAPAGTWVALGVLEGLPLSDAAHPLAVVGAAPPPSPSPPPPPPLPPSSPPPSSSLVVGTLGSAELSVFALPDRRLSFRAAAPDVSVGSRRGRGGAVRARVCGLAGDPCGAWLAVQDGAEGAVAALPWRWPLGRSEAAGDAEAAGALAPPS